jgi:cell division protein FtsB
VSVTHNYINRDRNHWILPLALLTAIAMLVFWFPASALWHQQSEIDSTTAQIAAIRLQDQALQNQAKSVSSTAAATLLAREQYQLVAPGQSLIQVLPGDGSGKVSQSTGDPGLQPLVSPTSVSSLETGATSSTNKSHKATNDFLTRFVRTLEFWH